MCFTLHPYAWEFPNCMFVFCMHNTVLSSEKDTSEDSFCATQKECLLILLGVSLYYSFLELANINDNKL